MKKQALAAFGLLLTVGAIAAYAEEEGGSLIAPGEKVQKLAGGMKFTEGPAWIPATKTLVFSDIPNSKLMQWREGEGLSVFRQSEQANGNILDLQGRLISCQHAARNLVRTEADGKKLEQIAVPEGPANVCFGGEDMKTLFITASTSLYSVRMTIPGAKPVGAKW